MKREKFLVIRISVSVNDSYAINYLKELPINEYSNISIVGKQSEYYHDIIDDLIIENNQAKGETTRITTTWHDTEIDLQDYLDTYSQQNHIEIENVELKANN